VSLALVVAITFFVYHRGSNVEQQHYSKVAEMVVREVDTVPSPAILADFEAIEKLPLATDEDLLAALQ
jgi:hypothetical protein